MALTAVLVPFRRHFWLQAVIGSLFMAALTGWLARLLPQRPDQPRSSLADLLDHDSTVGSSVVPRVPPRADHVPLEIRVGLVSQSHITALRPGPNVLCRYKHGPVIPTQELVTRIASSPQHEIHCSGGPVQINQQNYQGDVSLLKGQGDWLPAISHDLETYVASVVGTEMPSSWHREALKAQAVAARSYPMAHLARPATTAYHLGDTTRWQVFAGRKSTTLASRSATRETRGIILSYSGGIVESLYASNPQVSAEAHGHLGANMSQSGAQQFAHQVLPFNAILGRYHAGASRARLTWHDQ
ncbi:SpoIID/LytB domain-containing protein [Synechococcus sp. WH 8109]|uniref:SpoIID/LytB domain-containing protein n=1 Tax=Synechococcus sp. WH 8109 TaxID=166314 RepID=UPI001E41692B|nr:SpoIID/LytB domain-containing protein [Synechococcus sp. WH 8109]